MHSWGVASETMTSRQQVFLPLIYYPMFMKSNWLVSYGGCSIDNLSHNLWIGVQGSQHGLLHFSEGVLLMLNFLLPRVSQSHSLKVVSSYLISNPRTAFCYHHPSYSQSKSLTLHLELKMANMMKLAYNIAKVLNLQYICWQCASIFFLIVCIIYGALLS
jgi:hypothetical protein